MNMDNQITPETGNESAYGKKSRLVTRHLFLVLTSLTLFAGAFIPVLTEPIWECELDELLSLVVGGAVIVGGFMIYPWVLTAAEIYLTIFGHRREEIYKRGRIFDVVGIPLGILYSVLYLGLVNSVEFGKDWNVVLYNAQIHTPIFTQSVPTIWTLALVGYAGYLIVNFLPLKKLPPLVPVLGMAAMYLGTVESILWGIQVYMPSLKITDIYLLLFPVNCIIATARTVRRKVWEWEQTPYEIQEGSSLIQTCNRLLMQSKRWPFAAFLLMWPLLGILIALLLLVGQRPDAVIKAFTETADWNLSQRVAPQNVFYDEHYLCTVAAGGHKNIVKPLRLGVRHGHEVIVNRQLCVANAFEQILEEKTPGLHRVIRHIYDTCGFPVAKLIRSKYMADVIYFLMKPLEWFFLIVLYLTDINPENRIALQYTGKSLRDFL